MDASDGKVIEVTNPATNEFIDTVDTTNIRTIRLFCQYCLAEND